MKKIVDKQRPVKIDEALSLVLTVSGKRRCEIIIEPGTPMNELLDELEEMIDNLGKTLQKAAP